MKRPTNIFLIAFIMLLLLCHCGRDNSSQKEEIPDYLYLGERTNEKIMGQYWIDDGRRTVFIRGGDVISNEKIAVEVAKPILFNAFGKEIIEKNLPFRVELINDSIWLLSGTLSANTIGGTFHMSMLKWNGQVIAIWGGK